MYGTDSRMSTPLSQLLIPPSLEDVSIRSTPPKYRSLTGLMHYWRSVRVRRFSARELYSLRDVLPAFLALRSHAVEMHLPGGGDDVALSAMPDDDNVWMLSPSLRFLVTAKNLALERLVSSCVAFPRLGSLLLVDARGLEKLDL